MPQPYRIAIKPSITLALGLGVAHCGAAAATWLAPVPASLRVAVTALIALSLVSTLLDRAALRTGRAIVALEFRGRELASVLTRAGLRIECELLGSSFVLPWLTVLNLRQDGSRIARHVVVVPDNVAAEDFRRLRVWLRWAGRGGDGGDA